MSPESNKRIFLLATMILVADQVTKLIVINTLPYGGEKIIVDGFFKFVHWGNTGAAWSMFSGNNHFLTFVAVAALIVLFLMRRHFGAEEKLGQIALGLMFGGIIGNIIDRIRIEHVTDFIYFYLKRRGGTEIGFPAFNIADSAICIGVGLLFVLSWQADEEASASDSPAPVDPAPAPKE
ncbi:MAG: signal peptidase II [Verrucomicrobiales bacterium]|nr:signal peptidase II [Verrucomicrobiales bacterium]|tara:strand:- start:2604 stop:3140 length:537 start_codon:yes stop_codon:yes gene_type:complete